MNILLTLGRMPKGLELARGLAANGCTVFVADPHKNHICRHSNSVHRSFQVTAPNDSLPQFIDDLLGIIKENEIELVIPVSEESVYTGLLIDRLPADVHYFGPDFETARRLHDKYYFNQWLHELGLPAPASALLGSDEASRLINDTDVIIKPVHASAGIDVEVLSKGSALPETTLRPSMCQQQMKGRLVTSLSIARQGETLATGVYEATILTGSVAVAFQRVDDIAAVEAMVNPFVEAINYTGFISFDLFIEADGNAYAIECNPRLTSGIHLFDNQSLARAVIDTNATDIKFRKQDCFQHFWPCLGITELSLVKRGPFRHNLHYLKRSSDVNWSRQDPLPFIMINFCSMEILKKYFREKVSLGEAAITDIEWQENKSSLSL